MDSELYRYIHTRGETYGPVDEKHLVLWFREGRFGPDDHVWIDEEERWIPARTLPYIAALVEPAGTHPPPRPAPAPIARPVRPASAPENLFAFEEARRFHRFSTQLPASYALLKPGKEPDLDDFRPCTLLNLSVGGAGVVAPETIPGGRVVRLFIPRLDDEPEPFYVQGKVVRTAPASPPPLTEHGIRFATPPYNVQLRLVSFLERLTSGR